MLKEKLFIFLQYTLPQHRLSRLIGLFTKCKITWFKNFIIRAFIRHFKVNMTEAISPSPNDYPTFNAFFSRKLKKDARNIANDPHIIISPVDGSISQIGTILKNRLIQAKGFDFTLGALLGGQQDIAALFENGLFATLYLSPRDYHCIHMPHEGRLLKTIYIPGDLFSVNNTTVNHVPKLFARNERIVCLFQTSFGTMAVILIGAIFVGSIHTIWAGQVTPPTQKSIVVADYNTQNIILKKGELLGHFELGSTVIVLLPVHSATFDANFLTSNEIKLGIPMAHCIS